ncbi:MAG: PD40 domain-containing protein [Thermoguttaceae bacterium]|nr:PD40 domain-containing protein [Thermoguttaceae bacterium]
MENEKNKENGENVETTTSGQNRDGGEEGRRPAKRRSAFVVAAILGVVAVGFWTASRAPSLPEAFETVDKLPAIYPDYVGTTIPPNVAPLNFYVEEEGDRYLTSVYSKNGAKIVVSGRSAQFPLKKWRKLLEANVGETLVFDVYVQKDGKWTRYQSAENKISPDRIDSWLAYRLIEPGYEYGHRISLRQRNIEAFEESSFFNNRALATSPCVNCHSFQNRETERFLFHYRRVDAPPEGGTILVDGKKATKVSAKLEDAGISCSYPAWRPTGDLVAFSTNQTRQIFHLTSTQKIEVFDLLSDLAIFDAKKNELRRLTETNDVFETFPTWAPDGSALYYCAARVELKAAESDVRGREDELRQRIDDFRYNVMKMTFDEKTGTFGAPETVVDAAARGRSALHPRISPDGRLLVWTEAASGTFPIWRPEADLFVKNLATGEERARAEANGENSDSYHSFDSSGRWMVFSSRREDGLYTRLYFTHINEKGEATRPFVLPQREPLRNRRHFKSYNVPELITERINVDEKTLIDAAARKTVPTKNVK